MDETRIARQADDVSAPLTLSEREQAGYAFEELACSDSVSGALRMSHERLEAVQRVFELGWALGVRTGHTGPAMANVPVDRSTVSRAFASLASWDQEAIRRSVGQPNLWQRVKYSGSVTGRHGAYWVSAIHALADRSGGLPELRYDLCSIVAGRPVTVVTNARQTSLEPLPWYRATF